MDAQRSRHHRVGLYPHIEPFRTGMLAVGDGHTLHYEECGRADGVPVVALHGGPGGGASPAIRRFFDPDRYRIVVFDQRGCGRSRPFSSLEHNTTPHLIDDIERLREALRIDRWVVFGGSWGATLSLAYARAHPDRTLGMVLRGVFACTKAELDWFYRSGANHLFPDMWERFAGRLSAREREDVLNAYYRRLNGDDIAARRDDALAWASWESSLIAMSPAGDLAAPDPRRADAISRIETHYFVHGGFLERDGVLLEETAHLKSIPGAIVQGRYDMVTPPKTAWTLSQAWPRARLEFIHDAGHAAGEPGIIDGLVRATDRLADTLE
ncbi:prolyl aminopeptidase [Marinicauda sp. Alg238-R41]|jgi:proline iminopeptidase|uniref:prolyl aminopeptidase n=1 Tax=Marinicauda sp. Alg238-R41 TaxID=2993447 RepID=UPI0022E2EBE4|nr:prolyl aminopeptidase [Marinicauda sp. Alg238-R41]